MVKIAGTGHYVPKKILTNHDLEAMVDTSDEWIMQRTGIKTRHVVENEVTSDLAVEASKKAMEAAGLTPNDIDLIIVGTSTPDYHIPACAPIVQNKLGCRHIPAFDINSVCTSFMCGFTTAYSMLASGLYKNCLLIGADTYSKILNWKDRNSCVIFGDGAGAMVLVRDDEAGKLLSSDFGADGSGADYIKIQVGGVVNPLQNFYGYKEEDLHFQMAGKKVYEFTISVVPDAVVRMLEQANISNEEIDHVILHQANVRIIDTISKMTEIERSKFIVNIDKYGNTSSASIPIALDEALRAGKIKKGETVMMLGFGGGLSWGGVIYQL